MKPINLTFKDIKKITLGCITFVASQGKYKKTTKFMPWAVVPSTASEDDVRAAAEVAKMSLSHFQSLMQPEQLDPSSDAAHVAPPEEEGGWWLVLAWQTGHWNLADDVVTVCLYQLWLVIPNLPNPSNTKLRRYPNPL